MASRVILFDANFFFRGFKDSPPRLRLVVEEIKRRGWQPATTVEIIKEIKKPRSLKKTIRDTLEVIETCPQEARELRDDIFSNCGKAPKSPQDLSLVLAAAEYSKVTIVTTDKLLEETVNNCLSKKAKYRDKYRNIEAKVPSAWLMFLANSAEDSQTQKILEYVAYEFLEKEGKFSLVPKEGEYAIIPKGGLKRFLKTIKKVVISLKTALRQPHKPPKELSYKPDSKILIVTICSYVKEKGGGREYNVKDSIRSKLRETTITDLLRARKTILNIIKQDKEITWKRVPAFELKLNEHLVCGKDFGGDSDASYKSAIDRYSGRFYLALGQEGKEKLFRSRHHILIVSGLYGLITPTEPIQLYSCPLVEDSEVQKIWKEDNVLTKVLMDYVKKEGIERIFDLTALKAYRDLIDWSTICNETEADVLYCFEHIDVKDQIGAGASALIAFGKCLKDFILEAKEDVLLAITPETKRNSILFRAEPGEGLSVEEELEIKPPSFISRVLPKRMWKRFRR